ncbi:hypothetical protein ACJIZ3_003950 [Penstemon smallii]|uniref:mitogen-activated protein kinase kinase kinase n=1 Tax=Penstemon smallii TaxID=265156 RepID=A0ABD3S0R1_9LAMI
MGLWWGKSSKETKKKSSKESIISWHKKFISPGAPRKGYSDSSSDKESQASDYETGINSASPSKVKQREHTRISETNNSREILKPSNILLTNEIVPESPKHRRPLKSHIARLHIPHQGASLNTPTNSKSSPSRSPMRVVGQEPFMNTNVQQSHQLPLPPVSISTPFSPCSAGTALGTQRSPGRTYNPKSPGSRWKKGRLLGRGTFGHVFLGFDSESGEMCAMKEVSLFSDDPKSKESAQQLGQEIAFLSRLRHPNIVQYYGSETIDDKVYIYLEYVSGGSIYKNLQEYGQLGEAAIRSYTQQILSGLAYLHAKNTLHRDIKGANILVDPNGRIKLADFGMAKHITGPSCPLSMKGSPYWMAPEVIKTSSGYNLAVDIWSLGCTVLEMATTKPPWSQYEGVAAMFKIGYSKELPEIPDHLSDEGKDFVMQCLQRNPSKRPTASQLLEHPFVKNTASVERPILSVETIEAIPSATHAVGALAFGHCETPPCLDSPGAVSHSKSPKIAPGFSDASTTRNVSHPFSPKGSPLSRIRSPRSPQQMNLRLSPSPISSPQATSGSSTTANGGNVTLPLYQSQYTVRQNINGYLEQKPNIFRGIVQAHLSAETVSRKSGFIGNKVEQKEQLYNAHLVLANRVSLQLLRNPVRINPMLDLNLNSPTSSRNNGI